MPTHHCQTHDQIYPIGGACPVCIAGQTPLSVKDTITEAPAYEQATAKHKRPQFHYGRPAEELSDQTPFTTGRVSVDKPNPSAPPKPTTEVAGPVEVLAMTLHTVGVEAVKTAPDEETYYMTLAQAAMDHLGVPTIECTAPAIARLANAGRVASRSAVRYENLDKEGQAREEAYILAVLRAATLAMEDAADWGSDPDPEPPKDDTPPPPMVLDPQHPEDGPTLARVPFDIAMATLTADAAVVDRLSPHQIRLVCNALAGTQPPPAKGTAFPCDEHPAELATGHRVTTYTVYHRTCPKCDIPVLPTQHDIKGEGDTQP